MSSKAKPQGEKLQLKGVRLSFPALHKPTVPRGYDDSKPKYGANFLMDPKDENNRAAIKQCNAEIKRLITEAWGTQPPKMKPIDCFGKGEIFTSKTTKKPYAGYEGMYCISAKSDRRPLLLDKKKTPLTPEEAEKLLYAGCYVTAIVRFWVQDNQYGEAIRCSLEGVKFVRDGEAFGSGGASTDDFDDDDDLEDGDLADEFEDDDIAF